MSEKAKRTTSYAEDAAKDNSIFTLWTKTWGLHIRPWYSVDKVAFCFVEKGKAGKGNSFTIYMDITKYGAACLMKWIYDILSPTNRFERVMAKELADGEKYPKTYKYVTGLKGNKTIGICNSQKGGYCINASVKEDDTNKFCNIPLDFGDLQMIAHNVLDTYEARKKELLDMRANAEESMHSIKEVEKIMADSTVEVVDDIEIKEDAPTSVLVRIKPPKPAAGGVTFDGVEKKNSTPITLFASNEIMKGEQKDIWFAMAEEFKKKDEVLVSFLVLPGEQYYTIKSFG